MHERSAASVAMGHTTRLQRPSMLRQPRRLSTGLIVIGTCLLVAPLLRSPSGRSTGFVSTSCRRFISSDRGGVARDAAARRAALPSSGSSSSGNVAVASAVNASKGSSTATAKQAKAESATEVVQRLKSKVEELLEEKISVKNADALGFEDALEEALEAVLSAEAKLGLLAATDGEKSFYAAALADVIAMSQEAATARKKITDENFKNVFLEDGQTVDDSQQAQSGAEKEVSNLAASVVALERSIEQETARIEKLRSALTQLQEAAGADDGGFMNIFRGPQDDDSLIERVRNAVTTLKTNGA
eukprot:TRINITY_DN40622_c0_g1_i1.p1 TRINITY_DN40622_c0_g1~~TRINITY_DN40622_c0_g1_i1.p1  ORF type:complete len:302 (+),score=86.81 TRINITY_DN40622_c0_g1_i1:64-969(+)